MSAEVHAGGLSVSLQAITFFVANILKDLDPLVENISTSKHNSSKNTTCHPAVVQAICSLLILLNPLMNVFAHKFLAFYAGWKNPTIYFL